ncbi:permease prefix domain 1-containing protein [Kocuria nitroreducens]|uniref:permease prefix domain 1-containing protein n=1 Tax=Kocuria nitroreducens TaxID=3058914 RepID=UPI0036DCDCA8
MTSLTDRYIWAAVRTVPESQRSDISLEIKEMIEEAIDARLASGQEASEAEHAALTQLGDPERLAADFADRPLTLVGPRYYLEWLRLLKTIAFTAVPIATIAVLVMQLLSSGGIGGAIGSAVTTALHVTVHIGFWTTVLFVILERSGTSEAFGEWTPDRLPELTERSRDGRLPDLIASLVFLALFAGAIIWQQVGSVVRDTDGDAIPVLDPALWSFWLPWFLGLIAAEAIFATWIYRHGWSWAAAVVNSVLGLAFAVPAVFLVFGGKVLNPAFLDAVDWSPHAVTGGGWMVSTIVAASIVIITAWDVVDGFIKAKRSSTPALRPRVTADC